MNKEKGKKTIYKILRYDTAPNDRAHGWLRMYNLLNFIQI